MYILLVKKNDNVFDTVYTMHLDMRSFIKKNMQWGMAGPHIDNQVNCKFLKMIFLDINYNLIEKNPNVLLLKTEYLLQLL